MVPGGVTEIIWHFAGYLHIAEDVARDRINYEDGALRLPPQDYTIKLVEAPLNSDLEEFDTARIAPPLLQFVQSEQFPEILDLHLNKLPFSFSSGKPLAFLPPLVAPPFVIPSPGASAGHASAGHPGHVHQELKISVTYQNGGDQTLMELNQFNGLKDNDQFQVHNDDEHIGVSAGSAVTELHNIDIPATLKAMVAEANGTIPSDLTLFQPGKASAAEFVAAHDAEMAAGTAESSQYSVEPGRYVNGELQEASAQPTPPSEDTAPAVTDDGSGQWAFLGGNSATNTAGILDLNEASGTMIVLGNYYKTNVIIQTNSFVDDDQVAVAGGEHEPGNVVTSDNKADNIAEFIQKEGIYAPLSGTFGGWKWNVDVVDGNYYDIRLLTQRNFISDNDVTLQDSYAAHFQVTAGENEQFNLANIRELSLSYDLIIVAGDYHGANWIFQHNIILDNDIVMVAAEGENGPVQLIFTGNNELLNDGSITNYGDDSFSPVSSSLEDLIAALASREGNLDPSLGALVTGNGSGVLNVLYVTGDYYDINAIYQINVMADVDTAIQFLSDPANDVTQSASAGDNEAVNKAAIVDVGSTSTYVAGEVYEDTILIQADLVSDDKDTVVHGDTETLVAEVIAFTGPPEEEHHDDAPVTKIVIQDDTLGSVLT
jgi:hypothetical protein